MCENVIEFKTKDELLQGSSTLYIIITKKNSLWYAISTLLEVSTLEEEVMEQLLNNLEGIPAFPTKELCIDAANKESEPFKRLGISVKLCSIIGQEL